jgi:hypothetical protein
VPVEPDVKSSKTHKLFNAGVSGNSKTGKSADPVCYNAVTVKGRTGLFEIVERDMQVVINDGGRAVAEYKGRTGDCGCRAVSIATGRPYQEIYDAIIEEAAKERMTKRKHKRSHPRTGVWPATLGRVLFRYGFKWVATMKIGSGCKVHLRADELPSGRIIARVSKHYVAVVDGIVHDTFDPARDGTRCVYGYWIEQWR